MHGGQCSWIVKGFAGSLGRKFVGTGLLHCIARQFITLSNVRGDINSLVRVTHKINEH